MNGTPRTLNRILIGDPRLQAPRHRSAAHPAGDCAGGRRMVAGLGRRRLEHLAGPLRAHALPGPPGELALDRGGPAAAPRDRCHGGLGCPAGQGPGQRPRVRGRPRRGARKRQDRQRSGRAGTSGRLGGPSGPGRRDRCHLRIPRRTGPENQDPARAMAWPRTGSRPRCPPSWRRSTPRSENAPWCSSISPRVPGRGSAGQNGSADRCELSATTFCRARLEAAPWPDFR